MVAIAHNNSEQSFLDRLEELSQEEFKVPDQHCLSHSDLVVTGLVNHVDTSVAEALRERNIHDGSLDADEELYARMELGLDAFDEEPTDVEDDE